MPNSLQPQRQGEPAETDADLAALLAGTAGAVPGLRPVADVLAALTAEATAAELAGEARALAEFRRRAAGPVPSRRARRGAAGLTSRLGVKVGASAAAVAVALGGGAAAAFAGVLPAPIQRLAHDTIGAPAPAPRAPAPTSRHGRGPAAHGRPADGKPAHGKPAARGGPGAKHARPHATPAPAAQGKPHAQGKHRNPHGKGTYGQGDQGNGGGQGNAQGQANGKGQGNGQGQQGGGPHNAGKQGNLQEGAAQHPARDLRPAAPTPARPHSAGHGSLRLQGPSHAQGAVWRRRGGPGGRPSYSRPTAQPTGLGGA
jgi:hypothetical protein